MEFVTITSIKIQSSNKENASFARHTSFFFITRVKSFNTTRSHCIKLACDPSVMQLKKNEFTGTNYLSRFSKWSPSVMQINYFKSYNNLSRFTICSLPNSNSRGEGEGEGPCNEFRNEIDIKTIYTI